MGVTIQVLQEGNGKDKPVKGDVVTIHYIGTLTDGKQFDSSRDRSEAFKTKIGVGQVIRGWDEGIVDMSLGEKCTLTVSPDYGYGESGYPPLVPGGSTLIFDIELLAIN